LLSYRHAFHAGNHADVLKHVALVALLDYLTAKPKPLWYVDTHAGAGVYALDRGFAAERGEFDQGIGRLWGRSGLPPAVQRFVDLVRELNAGDGLLRYPGSPWFARRLLRPGDRLWLYELHGADHAALSESLRGRSVRIERGDGLEALRRLLPPQPKRALVLVDPSYEVKDDYQRVLACLEDGVRRFPSGSFALWYPLIDQPAARLLPDRLDRIGAPDWLHVRLRVRGSGPGLFGSGMFVINPPYTLPDTLAASLPVLVAALGQDDRAGFDLDCRLA
jgi:23S rRNA (adenine2030-N6)-methyltransferase